MVSINDIDGKHIAVINTRELEPGITLGQMFRLQGTHGPDDVWIQPANEPLAASVSVKRKYLDAANVREFRLVNGN